MPAQAGRELPDRELQSEREEQDAGRPGTVTGADDRTGRVNPFAVGGVDEGEGGGPGLASVRA